MIARTATARIQRLVRWLEPFQPCLGHRAQRLALSTYVRGLFSEPYGSLGKLVPSMIKRPSRSGRDRSRGRYGPPPAAAPGLRYTAAVTWGNGGGLGTEPTAAQGFDQSLVLTVPPLGFVLLKK